MSWTNLAVWNFQIGLLVAVAAVLTAVFRLRPAQARLLYWQILLVACLVLPAIQPWPTDIVMVERPGARAVTSNEALVLTAVTPSSLPAPRRISWPEIVVWMLITGVAMRMTKLGLGLVRLRRYRRAALALDPVPPAVDRVRRQLCAYPEMAVSEEVSGPVTFGFLNPVILLPTSFPDLDPEAQAAVACHELLHVRRRDWLFTAAEEIIRAVFWFHPAIWWVLGQIQLAREQSVDREVVRVAVARERYVDALLAISGARNQLDLAPAPLFLRRRHLTARVAALIKEADVSYRRVCCCLAACIGVLLVAGWLVCGSLPLKGAPQLATDGPGITVTGVDRLMHRTPVEYPAEARNKGIEGTVLIEVALARDGTVEDAMAIDGPAELRQAALASVLKWHFSREALPRQRVSVQFRIGSPSVDVGSRVPSVEDGVAAPELAFEPVPPAPPGSSQTAGLKQPEILERLLINGLSGAAEQELRARLRLQVGQTIDDVAFQRAREVVRQFDDNLRLGRTSVNTGTTTGGVWLTINVFDGGSVRPEHAGESGSRSVLSDIPRRLHVDIQGLSPEATADLRQRLAVREGEALDRDAFLKKLERIHQIVKAFDPHLNDSQMMGKVPRNFGPDGKLIPPDSMDVTLIISPRPSTPGAGSGMEQYARFGKAVMGGIVSPNPPRLELSGPEVLRLVSIRGLSSAATEELRQRLQLQEGQTIDNAAVQRAKSIVREFDERLSVTLAETEGGPAAQNAGGMRKTGVALMVGPFMPRPTITSGNVQNNPLHNSPKKLHVEIQGLSSEATAELRQRLAVREGEILDPETFNKELARIRQVIKEFDPHLSAISLGMVIPKQFGTAGQGVATGPLDATLTIRPVNFTPQVGTAAPELPPSPPGVQRIEVPGDVQKQKLILSIRPVYPEVAKKARISGTVQIAVLIGTDGKMKRMTVTSGHPLLVRGAMDAVKEYHYAPTVVNGTPAEVQSTVTVSF